LIKPRAGAIYVADLEPHFGAEPGKQRPVLVLQTDLLNDIHPTVIVCPLSTQVRSDIKLLRVHIPGKHSGLKNPSDVLIDQIRAIDVHRLKKEIGQLSPPLLAQVRKNLMRVLDL
jgi:mRNA interferase MazF